LLLPTLAAHVNAAPERSTPGADEMPSVRLDDSAESRTKMSSALLIEAEIRRLDCKALGGASHLREQATAPHLDLSPVRYRAKNQLSRGCVKRLKEAGSTPPYADPALTGKRKGHRLPWDATFVGNASLPSHQSRSV
jgi:hypothetical protein